MIGRLIAAHKPDIVVVACNTASTIVLPTLRTHFAVPFVGTVPAIKPACAASATRLVSVLGTEATVTREYTRSLIRAFAGGCEVTLVGSPQLATFAERHLRGEPVSDAAIAAEIAPCFVAREALRTDTIVLACTHYPLLLDRLERLAPWPVRLARPGAGNRAARGGADRPARGRRQRPTRTSAVHLRTRSQAGPPRRARRGSGSREIVADRFDTPSLSA